MCFSSSQWRASAWQNSPHTALSTATHHQKNTFSTVMTGTSAVANSVAFAYSFLIILAFKAS